MTFLKTTLFALIAAASVQAVAAPITHTITLEANVPSTDFYVVPKDSTWITQTQALSYNPYSGDLSELNKQFDVKNSGGSITGKLLSPAVLSSGTASIPLTVKFNNTTLSTTGVSVVSKTAAAAASTVNLVITPVRQGDYAEGNYSGNVQLSFDSAI